MTFRIKYYSRRLVLSLYIAAVVFLVLGVAAAGNPALSYIFLCLLVPCMVVVLDAHYDLKARWKAAGSPRTYVFPWTKYPS
jgi:hypothetical protein